jgi:energy-coupling factor transport system ATP-binding protein
LLDEPTKGLDYNSKKRLTSVLKDLAKKGITILIVTHDIEFACDASDRCGLLFNGNVVTEDVPEKFFSGDYYSTSVSKATNGYYENITNKNDIVQICELNGKKKNEQSNCQKNN